SGCFGSRPFGSRPLAWSPNSQRLALAGKDETITIWDAAGGQVSTIIQAKGIDVHSVSWSPNSRRVAVETGGMPWIPGESSWSTGDYRQVKTVRIWDAVTGQEVMALRGHQQGVRATVFSPDGRYLASTSWDANLKVWDLKTAEEVLSFNGAVAGGLPTWNPDG